MIKKLSLLLLFVVITQGVYAQTIQLSEKAIIDSGMDRILFDENNLLQDGNGNLHVFYIKWGSDTDFVYHSTSTDMGSSWSTPAQVSFHKRDATGSQYHISYVNSTLDNQGKFHLVFNYRGYPLYSASTNYPPEHISYVTNESGSWQTYKNVMDDSLALVTSAQSNSTSYCYGTNIISQNGTEYISAFNYAWFATKSHVLHAKRTSGGNFHAPGEPIVTFDRGAIDKYTLRAGKIIGDGNSLFTFWFNRFDGKLNIKTESSTGWGATQTIHTVSNPKDGVLNYYGFAAPQGNNGNLKAVFTRWEDDTNIQAELIVIDKSGSTWNTYPKAINERALYTRACVHGDTITSFYLTASYDTLRMIDHSVANGFSAMANVVLPNNDLLLNVNVLPNRYNPLLYLRRDANNFYTLAIGEMATNVGIANYTESTASILLYPNPVEHELVIRHNAQNIIQTVKLFTINGLQVKIVNPGENTVRISTRDLPSGIYLAVVTDAKGQRHVKKFIKN